MVTPVGMSLAIVKTTSGVTGSLTNEAMSELNWTSLGYPRYTVYEITDAAKRYLARSAVPTFEADVAGGGIFSALTPAEIQYAGGVIILSAARGATDVVRCATGTYYTTTTTLLGGTVARLTTGPQLQDITLLGDGYVRRYPTVNDFSFTLDTFALRTEATYTTSGGNANSHIVFKHDLGGVAGNSYSITMTDPGAPSQSLAVSVSGKDVTVSLATDIGSAITSTANSVVAAIKASDDCNFIQFTADKVTSETGLGVVAALGKQSLTGGLDATDHTAKKGVTLIVSMYSSTSGDSRWEGYAYLESIDSTLDPKSVLTENLSFKGDGVLYYRPA
jgi:hypothetical protein